MIFNNYKLARRTRACPRTSDYYSTFIWHGSRTRASRWSVNNKQIIVFASWTKGLGSPSSYQRVPPIKSRSSASSLGVWTAPSWHWPPAWSVLGSDGTQTRSGIARCTRGNWALCSCIPHCWRARPSRLKALWPDYPPWTGSATASSAAEACSNTSHPDKPGLQTTNRSARKQRKHGTSAFCSHVVWQVRTHQRAERVTPRAAHHDREEVAVKIGSKSNWRNLRRLFCGLQSCERCWQSLSMWPMRSRWSTSSERCPWSPDCWHRCPWLCSSNLSSPFVVLALPILVFTFPFLVLAFALRESVDTHGRGSFDSTGLDEIYDLDRTIAKIANRLLRDTGGSSMTRPTCSTRRFRPSRRGQWPLSSWARAWRPLRWKPRTSTNPLWKDASEPQSWSLVRAPENQPPPGFVTFTLSTVKDDVKSGTFHQLRELGVQGLALRHWVRDDHGNVGCHDSLSFNL